MIKKIFFIIAMIATLLLYGKDSFALIIGPSRFEVRLPAGEVADIDYYVQNDTATPVHVTVDAENWFKDIYNYTDLKIGDWIKIDENEFDLKPKEIKKFAVTVRVPKKASGEVAAQIFFASAISGTAGNAGGAVNARLGAILYVAIKDTEKATVEIKNIDTSNMPQKERKDKKQIRFNVILHNNGNVHIRPAEGNVIVYDDKGRQVVKLQVDTGSAVMPGQEASYAATWDNPVIAEGKYKASASIRYGRMYGKEKTEKFESQFEVDGSGKVMTK